MEFEGMIQLLTSEGIVMSKNVVYFYYFTSCMTFASVALIQFFGIQF